ncbi:MAG: transporter related [Xanthobacteraceae bacterium]|jgi:ATP-binding cassette subfamily C protein LapB|nr:transporter related [Xanthobacteraceae bacterium]
MNLLAKIPALSSHGAGHEQQPTDAPASPPPHGDPLADALLFLAAFHGRALTRNALLSGLPIADDRLSPQLFSRAAQRAGFEVEAVKRPLAEIPGLVLPAVLIMADRTCRILLTIDAELKKATVCDPSRGDAREVVSFAALDANYLGYAFFARPVAAADPRAVAAGDLPRSHWFWTVVKKFWANYSHVAIAAFVVNALALATPLFTMNVYDRVVPNGATASLIALSIGVCLALIFDFILRIVRSRIIDMTGKKIDVVLAADIFEHVMALKMASRPQSVGILANQLRDFDSVREFFTSGTVVSATDLLFAVLFIIVLFIVGGPLGWIPLFVLPMMIALGFLLQRPLDRAMKRLQAESAARHGVLVESLSGIETVRAAGAEARMQMAWERSVAATARSGEDVHHWSSLALTAASTAQQVTSLLMIIIGVYLILDGKLSMGALVAANMLAGRVLAPISGIAAVITRATQTFSAMKSIDRLMSLERERPPQRSYVARRVEHGSISFDNVTFKYPNSPENALEKISFKVAPGERVGIVGRVGSGKTTVGKLLVGFYEPAEGGIQVDGIDIRQYDPADLRAGVGFILQDTDLFYGKLRDNIALGKPNATDEEILAAARLSGVESFIAGHPLGYDMPIAEGGRSLSGGQKQAIGLARILIRKPKVLFLDEPTAHFDVRSEAEFLERLKAVATRDTTVVISTHRLSLLAFVDRLLLFERGRLVADGPRDEVLNKLRGTPPQPTATGPVPVPPAAAPIRKANA